MNDKKWLLMTYYCPTHGDLGRIEPFEIERQQISRKFLLNNKSKKKN